MSKYNKTDRQPVEAAYIHVPFCRQKCGYCDFISLAGAEHLMPDWHRALKNEIEAAWRQAEKESYSAKLKTIYFGGGTPSLLSPKQVAEIIDLLNNRFGLAQDCEITLETNPATLGAGDYLLMRQSGVNRLSLGMQTAQDRLLKKLGRIHTVQDSITAIKQAEAAGFERISTDMIIGLPDQTVQDVSETLDLILSLPVEHVSYYSLILEEGTPFYRCYIDHPELLPDEDAEREMYHLIIDRLSQAGFVNYEISNAARPGGESRHNLIYWQAKQYYGFGPAAHSYIGNVRRGNTEDVKNYIQAWSASDNGYTVSHIDEVLDNDDMQREMMMLGLRLLEGVSRAGFAERYGSDPLDVFTNEISVLQKQGLIQVDDDLIHLTDRGLDLANIVFREFV